MSILVKFSCLMYGVKSEVFLSLNIFIIIFTLSFSINIFATTCFNSSADNSIDINLDIALSKLINKHLKDFKIPSASLLIGSSSKVLYKKAFGSVDAKKKNTIDTIFDLASITKVFTAASILKVLEEQNLQANDLITNVFPLNFNTIKKSTLTFEDLLRHKSGFKAGTGNSVFSGEINSTWNNILKIEPSFKYGDFKYSDINFLVLGKSVEELSRINLNSYVKKKHTNSSSNGKFIF
jgi:CubicO group peptidase (beta-lactamase class C family)